jgi:hypothetical protein
MPATSSVERIADRAVDARIDHDLMRRACSSISSAALRSGIAGSTPMIG